MGAVCGAELVIVVVLGGAGASTLFGWEGAIVALAVGLFAAETPRRRRAKALLSNEFAPVTGGG